MVNSCAKITLHISTRRTFAKTYGLVKDNNGKCCACSGISEPWECVLLLWKSTLLEIVQWMCSGLKLQEFTVLFWKNFVKSNKTHEGLNWFHGACLKALSHFLFFFQKFREFNFSPIGINRYISKVMNDQNEIVFYEWKNTRC